MSAQVARMKHGTGATIGGQAYFSGEYGGGQQSNVPLFERIGHDDMAELQRAHDTIARMEQRVADLERISLDLEKRLEAQARDRMAMDREMNETTRVWESRVQAAKDDSAQWKVKYAKEKNHCEKIQEKLRRTERELHRILQKKYDIVRQAKQEERQSMKEREQITESLKMQARHTSRGNLLGDSGKINTNPSGAGAQMVRERQVTRSLLEFFGMG
ncbi:unnamed protein product [Chrysoparadoxa australica]